jgi:DNA-binding transcriptional regulator YhcF (GntR family)
MQPVETTKEDTKKPSTDESIDYLIRRINQLQLDMDEIKKDNWINSNPRKFNYGDKVIFHGKECQVIEYKVHPSTVGFSWVYRLLEVGGTIVTHSKNGYLISQVQVGVEFQFESEISKVEKTKKSKKNK